MNLSFQLDQLRARQKKKQKKISPSTQGMVSMLPMLSRLSEESRLQDLAFYESPLYLGVHKTLTYFSCLELVDEIPKTALDSLINEIDLKYGQHGQGY